MKFDDAFKIVLGFEGGYVNDSDDRGGETNYGITASTLNSAKNKGWVPFNITIKDIKLEYAKTIYKKGYWDAVQADSNDMPVYGEVDFETLKQAKQFEIANTRYNAEIKGVQYGNMFIKTDRESRLAFIELYNRAKEDVNYSCSFKAINGWFNITAEDIIVINDLIRQYVQDCFDVENYLMQQVEQATTIEELENIDVENAFSN